MDVRAEGAELVSFRPFCEVFGVGRQGKALFGPAFVSSPLGQQWPSGKARFAGQQNFLIAKQVPLRFTAK